MRRSFLSLIMFGLVFSVGNPARAEEEVSQHPFDPGPFELESSISQTLANITASQARCDLEPGATAAEICAECERKREIWRGMFNEEVSAGIAPIRDALVTEFQTATGPLNVEIERVRAELARLEAELAGIREDFRNRFETQTRPIREDRYEFWNNFFYPYRQAMLNACVAPAPEPSPTPSPSPSPDPQ